MVQEKANEYLKEKINATIDMKFIDYGDYTQKMGVIINSGEPYDLAFTCSWANPYLENARKGAFLEIDEFQEMLGKMLRKWLKIVFFKNQEDIRMAVFRWFNNNI